MKHFKGELVKAEDFLRQVPARLNEGTLLEELRQAAEERAWKGPEEGKKEGEEETKEEKKEEEKKGAKKEKRWKVDLDKLTRRGWTGGMLSAP